MNVWIRGRAASLTAFQAASMSATCVRASPAMTGPSTVREIVLHRLEVARRGDREAGLDHVDAEPRELLGDLQLLLRVQRDPGRLLAVAQRRVEDQYSVGIVRLGHVTPVGLELRLLLGAGFAATCGRRRAIPPEGGGEEVEGRGGVPCTRKRTSASAAAHRLRVERLDLVGVLGVDRLALELHRRRQLLAAWQPSRGSTLKRLICSTRLRWALARSTPSATSAITAGSPAIAAADGSGRPWRPANAASASGRARSAPRCRGGRRRSRSPGRSAGCPA